MTKEQLTDLAYFFVVINRFRPDISGMHAILRRECGKSAELLLGQAHATYHELHLILADRSTTAEEKEISLIDIYAHFDRGTFAILDTNKELTDAQLAKQLEQRKNEIITGLAASRRPPRITWGEDKVAHFDPKITPKTPHPSAKIVYTAAAAAAAAKPLPKFSIGPFSASALSRRVASPRHPTIS